MMSDQVGAANPNWKGGRTVASNGYVLVKDRDNPMADVRGYVYEHRLVVSKREGRPLDTREQVHHEDEVKTNNRDDNLELCASLAVHRVRHRQRDDLRMHGEANPTVPCACGCDNSFERYDADGRPRRFVSGHNPQPAPTKAAILRALTGGPCHRQALIAALDTSGHAVAVALSKLKRSGQIEQAGRGIWRLKGGAS
jgi:hypothetical protein